MVTVTLINTYVYTSFCWFTTLYICIFDDMTWSYLCRLLLSYFCRGQVTRQNSKKNWALDDMVTHTEAMSLMGRVGWNMLKLWHRHSMMVWLESPKCLYGGMVTHDMIIIDHIWSYSPFIYSLKRYMIHIYTHIITYIYIPQWYPNMVGLYSPNVHVFHEKVTFWIFSWHQPVESRWTSQGLKILCDMFQWKRSPRDDFWWFLGGKIM